MDLRARPPDVQDTPTIPQMLLFTMILILEACLTTGFFITVRLLMGSRFMMTGVAKAVNLVFGGLEL